jgi:hypothetical protein
MSDALSFAELEEQHVELLPPRTVLSMISFPCAPGKPGTPGTATPGVPNQSIIFTSGIFSFHSTAGTATGGAAGVGGSG